MASKVFNPIRTARKRIRLTRDQLGAILGVAGRTVSSWETGERRPPLDLGPKLKATLGLTDGEVWRVLNFKRPSKIVVSKRRTPLW